MSRTLKRVPLDFTWQHNKVWEGYLNPYYRYQIPCLACDRTGSSPEARRMSDEWYGNAPFDPATYGAVQISSDHPAIWNKARRNTDIPDGADNAWDTRLEAQRLWNLWRKQWCHNLIQADVDALIAANRLMDFTHEPRTPEQVEIIKAKVAAGGNSWLPESNGYVPTATEVNDWSLNGMGHDSINQWVCVSARCKREGVEQTCRACKGEGYTWPTPELQDLYEKWTEIKPPTGPGFQLWEDCSEGSPISPVFKTLDELCTYATKHCTTFASYRATPEEWREMLDNNFVHHAEGNILFL